MWDQLTGADVEEMPRGEVIADFLSEYPDLVIMNDAAHHVHEKKAATGEELVWRQFMLVLHDRLEENHKNDIGVFLQIDFSATPFYGSAEKREYFPHIIYNYGDCRLAWTNLFVRVYLNPKSHFSNSLNMRTKYSFL